MAYNNFIESSLTHLCRRSLLVPSVDLTFLISLDFSFCFSTLIEKVRNLRRYFITSFHVKTRGHSKAGAVASEKPTERSIANLLEYVKCVFLSS